MKVAQTVHFVAQVIHFVAQMVQIVANLNHFVAKRGQNVATNFATEAAEKKEIVYIVYDLHH